MAEDAPLLVLREGGVATVYQVDDLEHERKVAHLPRMLADEV